MIEHFAGLRPARSAAIADIVVGLGARACAGTHELLALIDATLAEHHLTRRDIAACVTIEARCSHHALVEVAEILDVPLIGRDPHALEISVPNPSTTVLIHLGVASVAEAAALSFGSLIAAKRRSANATCALSRLDPAQLSSAAIAASTLSTSSAAP